MIDFFSSQNSSNSPTLILVIYSIILSLVLSSLLALTYEKTNKQVVSNRHFIQAMILIAIVAAMVMQAIGDSLARGLGMLGALSIIRFRNTIQNPRNIVFIFGSLAIGIACGVYGFYVATVGTVAFVITAFVLNLSPLSQRANTIGTLVVNSISPNPFEIDDILIKYCKRHSKTRFNIVSKPSSESSIKAVNTFNLHYQFRLKDNIDPMSLNHEIENLNGVKIKRFDLKHTSETV